MKSFRIILIVLIVGFFVISVFSQEVFAAPYTITTYPTRPGGGWVGGPFLINGSEVTYCVEVGEHISLGSSYYGSIDTYARQGGTPPGSLDSSKGAGPASVAGTPNKDYLDYYSQWLIANYLTQSLANQK